MATPQLSFVAGVGTITVAVQSDVVTVKVCDTQVIVGLVLSITVTVNTHVFVLPDPSVMV